MKRSLMSYERVWMQSKDPRTHLTELRQQIDAIDQEVLALLNKRGRIAQQIGQVKKTSGFAIVEPQREHQVVSNMLAANEGPLPNDSVERLFSSIMIEMRNLQRERKEGNEPC